MPAADNEEEEQEEDDDEEEEDDDFISKPPTKSTSCPSQGNKSNTTNKSYSGAILADEMGLGKTLTAIATVWTFVRRGQAKGIPSIYSHLFH